jgi:hypothetical protein
MTPTCVALRIGGSAPCCARTDTSRRCSSLCPRRPSHAAHPPCRRCPPACRP